MKLSILICTIAERKEMLKGLLESLERQIGSYPVEILVDDAEQMSVGMKRNRLLERAKGDYVCFIDDDDRVSPRYVLSILLEAEKNSDVINFLVYISENGSQYKTVGYSIRHKKDETVNNVYLRLPNHLMAVKRELAKKTGFKNLRFGEDSDYAKRLKPLLKTQSNINEPLYFYEYNSKTSKTQR